MKTKPNDPNEAALINCAAQGFQDAHAGLPVCLPAMGTIPDWNKAYMRGRDLCLAAAIAQRDELAEALRELADAAEAQARGDDDAIPMHLRCIDSAYMADRIIAARALLAKVRS